MNENIQAIFEMGKIKAPVEKLAREFCRNSKIGEYKCAVTTRFGFFCDLCLEDELLYLKSMGVHTVASCCGHGNAELASILTVGENSRATMQNMGYELIGRLYGQDNWRPKSTFLYSSPEQKPTARRVDLVNLLEAACDVLVAAGVLADDNSDIVHSHDGSRVFTDRENPRTEIYITDYKGAYEQWQHR